MSKKMSFSGFGCPGLVQKLNEQAATQPSRVVIPLRGKDDIPKFIKAEEESEKRAINTKIPLG